MTLFFQLHIKFNRFPNHVPTFYQTLKEQIKGLILVETKGESRNDNTYGDW